MLTEILVRVKEKVYRIIRVAGRSAMVSSVSHPGGWHWLTLGVDDEWACDCPAYDWRGRCAHVEALGVEAWLEGQKEEAV